jgi:hypothetical protein
VVATAPDELSIISGNAADAVALTHVPVTAAGLLAEPGDRSVDPRYAWAAVIRVLYDY